MPEDIYKPITKVLLKENDNLALIFPKDITKGEFTLYFFRVMRRYPAYQIYTECSTLEEYGTDGYYVDFNYIGTNGLGSGDNILDIWEERPFRLVHFGIGITPGWVWLYRAIPADVRQTGWGYEAPPKVTYKRDFVPGSKSPFEMPTTATETILYHKLSVYIALLNNGPVDTKPILSFVGAGYDVIPITDRDFIDKMLAGIKPVRYLTVGGLRSFDYVVPEEWKNNAVHVDKEVIETIMGGGFR